MSALDQGVLMLRGFLVPPDGLYDMGVPQQTFAECSSGALQPTSGPLRHCGRWVRSPSTCAVHRDGCATQSRFPRISPGPSPTSPDRPQPSICPRYGHRLGGAGLPAGCGRESIREGIAVRGLRNVAISVIKCAAQSASGAIPSVELFRAYYTKKGIFETGPDGAPVKDETGASVLKRFESEKWSIEYTDLGGKTVRRTIGTSKEQARDMHKREAEVLDQKHGLPTKPAGDIPVLELAEQYLTYLSRTTASPISRARDSDYLPTGCYQRCLREADHA